jgi:hypothetical protein
MGPRRGAEAFGVVGIDPATAVPLAAGLTTNGSFLATLSIPANAAFLGQLVTAQSIVEGRDALGQPELRLTNVVGQPLTP